MARKAKTFRLNEKNGKKEIILFTNVEKVEAEQTLINFYLSNGYTPKVEEKKAGKSVEEMRAELKKAPEVLAKFNEVYTQKNGFFDACKVYTEWVKNNKK